LIEKAWESESSWLLLLKPLEYLFRSLSAIRRGLYRLGWLRIQEHPQVIVVIGNLRVGGSGKTPTVIALAQLLDRAGYRPGVVSRGYGSRGGAYPLRVNQQTPVSQCGDEPLLIARRTAVPVVVDSSRNRAVRELAADCDIVISDDGLQHYAMGRDLEIVLIDNIAGVETAACLPCGPLREPASRLSGADWVLHTDRADTAGSPAFTLEVAARCWVNLATAERCSVESFKPAGRLSAVAGIARPERFFNLLEAMALRFERTVFPDHHRWSPAELLNLNADTVLMTEKDAVKCETFAGPHMWYLEIEARLPAAFESVFLQRIGHLNRL